jgi:hypothetical protein
MVCVVIPVRSGDADAMSVSGVLGAEDQSHLFFVAVSAARPWLLGHRLAWAYPGTFVCFVY